MSDNSDNYEDNDDHNFKGTTTSHKGMPQGDDNNTNSGYNYNMKTARGQ
jgi:hypothetical protein